MANHASEEGSGFPSERYCKDRYSAYKKLLADLAQHLGPENVKVIAFNCSLPESLKQSSALDVLDYLDKHARFSPINIQPLAELLTDAYRNDLVNDYVERYRLKYGTANNGVVYLFRGLTVRQYVNRVHAAVLMYKPQSAKSLRLIAWTDCKRTVIFRTVHARVDDGKLTDTVDSQ